MMIRDSWREQATISVDEAAQILGISRNSAYEAVTRAEIPVIRIGRRIRVVVSQLKCLLGEKNDDLRRAD